MGNILRNMMIGFLVFGVTMSIFLFAWTNNAQKYGITADPQYQNTLNDYTGILNTTSTMGTGMSTDLNTGQIDPSATDTTGSIQKGALIVLKTLFNLPSLITTLFRDTAGLLGISPIFLVLGVTVLLLIIIFAIINAIFKV